LAVVAFVVALAVAARPPVSTNIPMALAAPADLRARRAGCGRFVLM
jgi:hypothetical protein